MHIGFMIDGLAGGGAERVILTLAGGMVQRGHRVSVVSLRDVCAYPVPDGVELLPVYDDFRGPLRRQCEIGRRARQLDRVLRREFGPHPFDLAISSLPKTDRIVAATSCLAHAWFCLHGAVASTQLAGKHGLKRWIKARQLAATYRNRRLILVSPGLLGDLQQLGTDIGQTHRVIANPFDLDAIRSLANAPCPLDGSDFLLAAGRFHPLKRHDRLLQAFSRSGYPGKLVLLGSGTPEETRRIATLAASLGITDRVVFAGFADNPYPWLRAARALVLASDSEGFGNVLVEALACGTPVISTRCPFGPESILTGPLAAGLCALDPESLAAGIRRVLDAPPRPEPDALDRFALDHIVDAYLALAEPPTE